MSDLLHFDSCDGGDPCSCDPPVVSIRERVEALAVEYLTAGGWTVERDDWVPGGKLYRDPRNGIAHYSLGSALDVQLARDSEGGKA